MLLRRQSDGRVVVLSQIKLTDFLSALTTGSVLFVKAGGVAGEDASNLFWDDTNNRLGIGTVSPAVPLHIAGAGRFGGTLDSTKAAATGFTRVLPNFCKPSSNFAAETWTNATACTARLTGRTLPADAKYILLEIRWRALSNNAIGQRGNTVSFYTDNVCTNAAAFIEYEVREEVAVVAGTVIGKHNDLLIVPLTDTDTFHATQANTGGNGNSEITNYVVRGYWD